jgi:hypothetical protein
MVDSKEKVKQYLGYGMSPEDVALVLDYTGDDDFEHFKQDYAHELRIGRALPGPRPLTAWSRKQRRLDRRHHQAWKHSAAQS